MFKNRLNVMLVTVITVVMMLIAVIPAGAENPDTFLGLTDTPSSYDGEGGSVVFVENTSPDELLFSNTLYVNEVTGRVGVGSPTPIQKIHVYEPTINSAIAVESDGARAQLKLDSAANSLAEIYFLDGGSLKWALSKDTSDDLGLWDGAAGRWHTKFKSGGAIFQSDLDLDEGAANAIIGGDVTADGGYLIWSDADWNGYPVGLWNPAESDGPVHALWVRWMVQHKTLGDVQTGEGIVRDGESLLMYSNSDPRYGVYLDWDDLRPFSDEIALFEFAAHGNWRVTLLMMWLGD